MTAPIASCKNLKPKIPENLPTGYYFRVYPSTDRYSRATIVTALYRERMFWFDKCVNERSFEACWASRPHVQYVESNMRDLVKTLLEDLHAYKYLYGRHP